MSGGVVFTIGYEGASLVSFTETLLHAGVAVVVDVRRDPWSRRSEFRKHALEESLPAVGIAYRHEPRLGVPRKFRERFRDGKAPEGFAAWYGAEVLAERGDLLRELSRSVSSTTTALMCYEADPSRCHRSLVARELGRSTGLLVRHLVPDVGNSEAGGCV